MRYAVKNYKSVFAITLSLVLGLGLRLRRPMLILTASIKTAAVELCVLPTISCIDSIDTAVDHPPLSSVAAIRIDPILLLRDIAPEAGRNLTVGVRYIF